MGVRRAHHRRVSLARQVEVVGVASLAGHQARILAAADRRPMRVPVAAATETRAAASGAGASMVTGQVSECRNPGVADSMLRWQGLSTSSIPRDGGRHERARMRRIAGGLAVMLALLTTIALAQSDFPVPAGAHRRTLRRRRPERHRDPPHRRSPQPRARPPGSGGKSRRRRRAQRHRGLFQIGAGRPHHPGGGDRPAHHHPRLQGRVLRRREGRGRPWRRCGARRRCWRCGRAWA